MLVNLRIKYAGQPPDHYRPHAHALPRRPGGPPQGLTRVALGRGPAPSLHPLVRLGVRKGRSRRRPLISDRAKVSVPPAKPAGPGYGRIDSHPASIEAVTAGSHGVLTRCCMSPHPLWRHADATAPLRSRQRAPCCCPPPVGWGRVAQLCNGVGPRRRLCSTRPLAPHEPDQRTCAGHTAARIAQTCIVLPPLVGWAGGGAERAARYLCL